MAKFLPCSSFLFLFILSLLLSGAMVGKGESEVCQRVMQSYCTKEPYDPVCDRLCLEVHKFGVSYCQTVPGLPSGQYLCICTYPCA